MVFVAFAGACSASAPPTPSHKAQALPSTREVKPSALVDSAQKKLSEAFILFRQAADSGYLPAVAYVAQAYENGIGVENELATLTEGAYLYYSIGATLAAGSGQGEEFLDKSLQYEKGRSAQEVVAMRKRVVTWFENRPGLKPMTGKTTREH
jgi:TPR repeat protein